MLRLLMFLPLLARLMLFNGGEGGAGDGGGAAAGSTGAGGESGSGGDAGADGGEGGGSSGAGGSSSGGGASSGGEGGDKGFPENTPVAEMTVEQRESYWRHYARQHESRVKSMSDYDDLKAKAAKLEEIENANASEAEKAAKAARDEGKAEGLREAGSRMVDTHIEAAVTAGRLTQEQADVLLEGLDRSKYLTAEHTVDTDKVKTLLDRFATNGNGRIPDLGQGRRPGGAKPSVAAGRDMYESSRKSS